MAKVMISLPDDVLASLDAEAKRRGTTRSGVVRELAEQSQRDRNQRRADEVDRIMSTGEVEDHGGNGVELLRVDRTSH